MAGNDIQLHPNTHSTNDVTLYSGISLSTTVPTGTLTITGYAPTTSLSIDIPVGSLTITGYSPSTDLSVIIPVGALALTGYAPDTARTDPAIPTGSLTITGYAPATDLSSEIPTGSLTITGYNPDTARTDPAIPTGSLTITGYAPTTTRTDPEIPTGALALTGYAPTTILDIRTTVPTGALAITGYVPTTTRTEPSIPTGALALTGYAPTGFLHIDTIIPTGSLTFTGYAPTTHKTIPSSGLYNFNLTYFEIIRMAHMKCHIDPSHMDSSDVLNCFEQIQLIYSQWTAEYEIDSVMLVRKFQVVPGQYQIEMPPQTLDIVDPITVLRNGSDLNMERISAAAWQSINNKTQQGLPHHYWVNRQASSVTINFWCVEDSTDVMTVWYYAQPSVLIPGTFPVLWTTFDGNNTTFDQATTTFDGTSREIQITDEAVLSQIWIKPLIDELAFYLSMIKNMDNSVVAKLRIEADKSVAAAQAGDADISPTIALW